ncbi:MAG: hypothetical protein QOC96_1452 [Acidobacteriota bacterium]|nr:hypothetical protein [Acidobacteriota bacterium]
MTDVMRALRVIAVLSLLLLLASAAEAQTVKLESGWQLLADQEGKLKIGDINSAQGWRDARVGLSWNAQFADLRDYMGVAWYRTSFDVPQSNSPRHVLLRFGAVDYFSEVYVNGKRIGEHEGGYTPFSFDVTDALKPGANELVVRVIDPPMEERENRARFPQMMYNEIPHGKQNWYVQTGGIWQSVWLEIKPDLYIQRVQVIAKPDGYVAVFVFANKHFELPSIPERPGEKSVKLTTKIYDPSGTSVEFGNWGTGGKDYLIFQGRVRDPKLWSVDHPNLYTVEVVLEKDRIVENFGFRSFETRDGKFYLNGEPFYMMAALDQDFYPETIYTPPSEEFVRDEMLKAKRLGLNTLRCHIKVPDPAYLKVADEVGMLVWYEIPSWNDEHHFTQRAAERGEKIFSEQVARDWNHPSIVIQSIINESWGADLKQAEQRAWLRAAYDRAKKSTSMLGRLIVDNSACCDNFHVKSDIADFHQYFSIPDHYQDWDKWVADFATRPKWAFSQHGDAEATGREPLVVSEFGNWGLPALPKNLPWWFNRDFGGREVTRPAGLFDRFKEFGFARLFRDYDELARESEWHQFISLKHEIEEMRRYASIQGYVITELTDINWEANGLMDMWRNPKVYAAELAKIQKPDVILSRLSKQNYTSGERVEAKVLISHYSATELNGATVTWRTDSGASGQLKIDRLVERASVTELEPISFIAPIVVKPRHEKLTMVVSSRAGLNLAENSFEISVFPKETAARNLSLLVYDPASSSAGLSQALTAAGYKVSTFKAEGVDAKSLLVATTIDEQVNRHLRSGGRALILADSKEAIPANSSYKVTPREGSDLDGNWVTNFNWVKTDTAPFNVVAFTKILGFEASAAVPRYVIHGVRAADYGDVLAGIFYGWLNNNAALAVQMRAGNGKLFVTTFRFDAYGSDLYATRLLDAMIRYTSGSGFNPKLDWSL